MIHAQHISLDEIELNTRVQTITHRDEFFCFKLYFLILLNLCEDNFIPSGRSPDKSASSIPSGSSLAS
jgi:hypothetical protein